ncbi:TPA: hypothetical protein ACHSV6_004695 [Escherichia coli]
MKILQEEKNYWAAQCLEAREQAERANALADTYLASYEGEEKVRKELEERLELLFELMGIMQRTRHTITAVLNRMTAEGLREHCKRAEADARPLGVSETQRLRRILKKGEKIALYAIDTDHAEE